MSKHIVLRKAIPMIKVLILVVKRAGMSAEEFRAYYESSHVPLALKHFGHLFLEFRRNYPGPTTSYVDRVNGNGAVPGYDAGCAYNAITEIVLQDQAALEELISLLTQPEIERIFAEDEAKFTDRTASRMCVCEVTESKTPYQLAKPLG
jgi:hypothetical protein